MAGSQLKKRNQVPKDLFTVIQKEAGKNGIWQGSIYGWETLNKGMVTSAFCGAYLKGGGRGHEAWWVLNNFKDSISFCFS